MASADPMYWGGTIKGEVYGMEGEAPTSKPVLERFESDAGKQVSMVNTGQSWASFDMTTMRAAIAEGTIPLVTMRLEGATLAQVISGQQDSNIRAWAREAKAFGYPFLFRPWWEVNGDWYSWGRSPEYVEAWRHFHDLVVAEGATNVTWAWVVNTVWGNPGSIESTESNPTPWYPGSQYVDWVGIDAYNWGKNPIQPDRWKTAEESIQPTLDILDKVAPGKPVCICESASTEYGEEGHPEQTKASWIHEMLGTYLPTHPEIKAYLWFNWNVEKEGGTPGQRYDWPIESSAASQQAFKEGVQSETFLSALPPLTPLTKVPMPAWPVVAPPAAAPVAARPLARRSPKKSTRISLGRAVPGAATGSLRLPVKVVGPGTLKATGKGLSIRIPPTRRLTPSPASKWIPKPATVMIEIGPGPSQLAALAAGGSAKVSIAVKFSPQGGVAKTVTKSLTLRP